MAVPAWYLPVEGEAVRFIVFGAVAGVKLRSIVVGLGWLSAPLAPAADTPDGVGARAAPPGAAAPAPAPAPAPASEPTTVAAPAATTAPAPKATIGAPIVSPNFTAPQTTNIPASTGVATQAVAAEPAGTPQPEIRCNVNACT